MSLPYVRAHQSHLSSQWALIELARHPQHQSRLRAELTGAFPNRDPTWDELTYGLPYLDGVVHEVLRLHPAVSQTTREVHPPLHPVSFSQR